MSEKIVQLNEEVIKGQLKELVRGSVEEALIEMYLAGVSVRRVEDITKEVYIMGKRKERSPEEQERRGKIRELLELSGASSMTDIQELFKETIAEFMEDGLEAEVSEALGYIKYDYKQKETENSRNGHSSKKLRTSYGEVDVSIPRDRKGEFEPQLLKKNQTSISPDIEEKILSMYAKGMSTWDAEVPT